MRWATAAFGFCLVLGPAIDAGAAPFQVRLASRWCGSELDLKSRVQRRLLTPPPENWVFSVDVVSGSDSVQARVVSTSPAGAMDTRVVEGARCDSVLDAAALVIAVTLDPSLAGAPSPRPAPAPSAGPARAEVPGTRGSAQWRLGARGGVGTRSAFDDAGLELSIGGVLRRTAVFDSELSLEAVRAQGSVSNAGFSARFVLYSGRAMLAPVRLRLGRSVSVGPAAGVELGWLEATPGATAQGRSARGVWAAAGFELPLALDAHWVAVTVVPFATRRLKRDTFLAHGSRWYRIGPWDWGGRVGLTMWLW